MLVRIGIAAEWWGVSASTVRRWEKEKRVRPDCRTRGGHRRYSLARILGKNEKKRKRVVLRYVRVSATKQKKELVNQRQKIESYAEERGWQLKKIFADIASGMNDQRKGLQRLLNAIATQQPYAVVCTYEDRVARFGTRVIKHYYQTFNTKLVAIHQPLNQSTEGKLVEDMIALVTSFAGRLHRQRRGK